MRWPEYARDRAGRGGVGFDSIWVGDHLLYRDDGRPERGPWDVWTTDGRARRGDRARGLGPLVACLAFHPPGLVARMAARSTRSAAGASCSAWAAGWNEAEFRAFGIPFDHRVAASRRRSRSSARLLAGERVTLHGPLLAGRGRRAPAAARACRRSWSARAARGSSPPRSPTSTAGTPGGTRYGNTAEGFVAVNAAISNEAAHGGRPRRGRAQRVRPGRA